MNPQPPRIQIHCSGLPGRTTLRHMCVAGGVTANIILFRSSRPDYIETIGLLKVILMILNCSGLPGRTTLRLTQLPQPHSVDLLLFRSSRPDYIETPSRLNCGL